MTTGEAEGFELRLERLLEAPRATVWRCWTEPVLLAQWFGPRSWRTEVKALEPRPGGASHIVMHGPNGERSDGEAVFLEALPERRLVFTNAFAPGWIPSSRPAVVPFMTTVVDMSDAGDRTRHVVRALHWTAEARERHAEMGFQDGWAEATDRLADLLGTLRTGPGDGRGPHLNDIEGDPP
ncbi:SRPBCC family protein [Kocuria rhizosphaericola]|uniref:SRPBCC family protein n=1 Tax=Kocuria rhizosphaericola TaxID=3376284 RepID=UPI0037A2C0F8